MTGAGRYRAGYYVGSLVVEVGGAEATALRAASKWSGNFLPRLAARRRIPEAAFAESEYLGWTPDVSKMSDNEHTAAALWDSEILSIEYSPRHAIPEFIQRVEDEGKVASLMRGEKSGNLLDEYPA